MELCPTHSCTATSPGAKCPTGVPAGLGSALTVRVAILGGGGDSFAVNLDVFPAGAAVELVDSDLSAAELVRHCALRPHILVKIRRRVILPLFYA